MDAQTLCSHTAFAEAQLPTLRMWLGLAAQIAYFLHAKKKCICNTLYTPTLGVFNKEASLSYIVILGIQQHL